jgi:hypothetical protein
MEYPARGIERLKWKSVSAYLSELDWSRPHISLPLATAVCCPEINLILRMKSQPLLPGLVHHAIQHPSASGEDREISL